MGSESGLEPAQAARDEIRGRVTAFYRMSSRGGPAIGDVVIRALPA